METLPESWLSSMTNEVIEAKEEILDETIEEIADYLPDSVITSRWIPGWKIAGRIPRAVYRDKGQVIDRVHQTYREHLVKSTKQLSKKKAAKVAIKSEHIVSTYTDKRFTPWQNQLAHDIHTGNHVIADVTTSGGKSWATSLVVAHETLSTDDRTCLFISPSIEILQENVSNIAQANEKIYVSPNRRMIDTQTRSFCTYDDKEAPCCQIMCITSDNFLPFITNELNRSFIESLKFIVFDEVHLEEISETLWWSSFLPTRAQFILLSATIGDLKSTKALVKKITKSSAISVIKYHIRYIPLQRVVFKGCEMAKEGIKCSSLRAAGRLSCQINPFDPTPRDMLALNRSAVIPSDREQQWTLGQELMTGQLSNIEKLIDQDLETAVVELAESEENKGDNRTNAYNLYNLLCYIFSNGMQPALVFNTSALATKKMAQKLVAHIANVEREDKEVRQAQKIKEQIEREEYRARDELQELESKEQWGKMPEDTSKLVPELDLEVLGKLGKWRFPTEFGSIPDQYPQWVQDCLQYGIGVYLASFPNWIKKQMFQSFKEGKLQVMLADKGLSVGVNLPVRTVILMGQITPSLYQQMGGRSGRRGLDNQGYVISMFAKPEIKKCLLAETPPVSIETPTEMSSTHLISLLMPQVLADFIMPVELQTKRHRRGAPPPPPLPPMPTAPAKPTLHLVGSEPPPSLRQLILQNYLDYLPPEKQISTTQKIAELKEEWWHYHRLTHLVQALPFDESLTLIQLLVDGALQQVDLWTIINLIACLIQSRPATTDETPLKLPKELVARLNQLHQPPTDKSSYLVRFCKSDGFDYQVEDLDRLEKIGEWLYAMKRYLVFIAPVSSPFRQLIMEFDNLFLKASKNSGLM